MTEPEQLQRDTEQPEPELPSHVWLTHPNLPAANDHKQPRESLGAYAAQGWQVREDQSDPVEVLPEPVTPTAPAEPDTEPDVDVDQDAGDVETTATEPAPPAPATTESAPPASATTRKGDR